MSIFGLSRWVQRAAITAACLVLASVPGPRPALAAPALSPSPSPPATPAPGGTLTLNQAIAIGLQVNPALRGAQERLQGAVARVAQARAQRRFQITWSPSASGSSADVIQPPPKHELFGTLANSIQLPLPLGRRLPALQRQAEEEQAATTESTRAARLDVIQLVENAYYDVLRQQTLRAIATQNLQQAQRQLDDARIRFQAGDVAELDVLRAQVPVASAQAVLLKAQNDEAVARRTMNILLQLPPTNAPGLTEPPVPGAPGFSLEDAEARALAHAPDIAQATASVRAAEAALRAARLALEPSYSVDLSDTRSNDETGFSRLDSVVVAALIPLTDGGLNAAQVRERQAALAEARAALETARQTVRLSVDTAYLNAESARQQLDAAQATAKIASTAYDRAREAYQAGRDSIRDVLDAQVAQVQAQSAVAQATYDADTALAALSRALGEETR